MCSNNSSAQNSTISWWLRAGRPIGDDRDASLSNDIGSILDTNASLESINRTINKIKLEKTIELLETPFPTSTPIAAVPPEEEVAVIGKNGKYQLVRDENGMVGWMPL